MGQRKTKWGVVWGLEGKRDEMGSPGSRKEVWRSSEGLETCAPGEQVRRAFFTGLGEARASPGVRFPRATPPAENRVARGRSRGGSRIPRLLTKDLVHLERNFTRPSVLFPLRCPSAWRSQRELGAR